MSRDLGIIRTAIIDGINAQHVILGRNDPQPVGVPFAQWVEQGSKVGVRGVIDLAALAASVSESIARADAAPDPFAAEFDALGSIERVAGKRADDGSVLCVHCGLIIVPTPNVGLGWRHLSSRYLGCEPDHTVMAEP